MSTDTADIIASKTNDAIKNFMISQSKFFDSEIVTAAPDNLDITTVEVNQERNSILWKIFGGLNFDQYHYFGQMDSIINNMFGSEKRRLRINLGWTQNREVFPQISIILPSEENDPKNVGCRIVTGKQTCC